MPTNKSKVSPYVRLSDAPWFREEILGKDMLRALEEQLWSNDREPKLPQTEGSTPLKSDWRERASRYLMKKYRIEFKDPRKIKMYEEVVPFTEAEVAQLGVAVPVPGWPSKNAPSKDLPSVYWGPIYLSEEGIKNDYKSGNAQQDLAVQVHAHNAYNSGNVTIAGSNYTRLQRILPRVSTASCHYAQLR